MSARSLCYSISRETVRDYWGGVLGGSHRIGPQREVTHPKRIRLMSSWSISARLSRNTSFASTWSTHLKPDSAAEEPRVLRRQRGHSQSQNPVRAFAIRVL